MLMNCQQIILQQGLFHKHTEQFPVSDIGHFHQEPLEGVPKMLRKVIMEITVTSLYKRTNDTSNQQLFHSILPRKGLTNHILTYPKEHAVTAVAMITGLIPFLLHHYGDKTRKWFSLRALDGSSGSRWDKQTGVVITPNDKVVHDGLSSEYWWLADTLQGVEDQEPAKPAQPAGRNANAAGTFSKNMETTYRYNSY
jgi:hypothetical protein